MTLMLWLELGIGSLSVKHRCTSEVLLLLLSPATATPARIAFSAHPPPTPRVIVLQLFPSAILDLAIFLPSMRSTGRGLQSLESLCDAPE